MSHLHLFLNLLSVCVVLYELLCLVDYHGPYIFLFIKFVFLNVHSSVFGLEACEG